MESVVGSSYPVEVELDAPYEVARWRPFFAWLVAIPHLIVLYVIGAVAGALLLIAWFAILFTGKIPSGIFGFASMYLRYQWRTMTFAAGLHDSFPPFEFEMRADDDGHSPATLSIEEPESLSRGLIFVKWLLAIPHVVVLCVLGIGAFVAFGIGAIAVLFTGRWPEGIRDFLVGFGRWSNRVNAYVYLLTDEYPPFSLQ